MRLSCRRGRALLRRICRVRAYSDPHLLVMSLGEAIAIGRHAVRLFLTPTIDRRNLARRGNPTSLAA